MHILKIITAEDRHFGFANIEDSHITDNLNSLNKYENHEEKFEQVIQAQLKYNADIPISKEHLDCIKRLEKLG